MQKTDVEPPQEATPEAEPGPGQTLEPAESGIGKLPQRLQKYANARRRAVAMRDYLEKRIPHMQPIPGSDERHEAEQCHTRLCECGTVLHFRHYHTIDRLKLLGANFCQLTKLCPLCAIRRESKQLSRYLERYHQVMRQNPALHAYLVTLTVKNGEWLDERINHLKKAVKRLVDRRRQALSGNGWGKTEFRKVSAAVGTYEVTNRGRGWHPHVHMIVLATEPLDQVTLCREWQRSTEDSYIVDCLPLDEENPQQAFFEVFKYALKFHDMDLEDNWEAHLTLKRMRMRFAIGAFFGIPEDEAQDEPLEDLPYVDLFFTYLEESHCYTYLPAHDTAGVEHPREAATLAGASAPRSGKRAERVPIGLDVRARQRDREQEENRRRTRYGKVNHQCRRSDAPVTHSCKCDAPGAKGCTCHAQDRNKLRTSEEPAAQ